MNTSFEILFIIMFINSGLISYPIKFLYISNATFAVVPLPKKVSNTVSFM